MRITVFNGSPKGEYSNTNVIVTAFLKGAEAAGAEVENVLLSNKEINHCKGCISYCMTSQGECCIKDDMEELLPKYLKSDIVVFATPLQIDNVSGMLKVFMDRTFCIGHPFYEKDEHGEYRGGKPKHFKDGNPPRLVIISNGGYPQKSNFQAVSHLMKRFARQFHMELIAEIYAPQGGLLTAPVKELEPVINSYKELLFKVGQEIAADMRLSHETQVSLEKTFIPVEDYVQKMNQLAAMFLTHPKTGLPDSQ